MTFDRIFTRYIATAQLILLDGNNFQNVAIRWIVIKNVLFSRNPWMPLIHEYPNPCQWVELRSFQKVPATVCHLLYTICHPAGLYAGRFLLGKNWWIILVSSSIFCTLYIYHLLGLNGGHFLLGGMDRLFQKVLASSEYSMPPSRPLWRSLSLRLVWIDYSRKFQQQYVIFCTLYAT